MTRAARKAAAERRKQVPDENVQQKVDNRCYRDYAQSGAGGMRRGEGDHAQSSAGGMRFGEGDHAQSGAGGMRRGAGDHAQSGAGSYMRPVTSDYAQAPSDDYDRLLNRTMMEEALDALDGKFREVIVLYYYGEMSVKEIADTLGVFEGTVKSRLYFGRRKLKSIVQRGTGETAGRGAEAKERTPGLS